MVNQNENLEEKSLNLATSEMTSDAPVEHVKGWLKEGRNSVPIGGITCAACALKIEKGLGEISGIKNVVVNYATKTAHFDADTKLVNENSVKKKVYSLGYEVDRSVDFADRLNEAKKREKDLLIKSVVSLVISVILMILTMGWYPGGAHHHQSGAHFQINIIQAILTLPILLWAGLGFGKAVLLFFRTFSANMNTLVGFGAWVSFIYSLCITFFPEYMGSFGVPLHVYYEVSAFIISFILFGRWLEERAKSKTEGALSALLQMQAKDVHLWRKDQFVDFPLARVRPQDRLRVLAGERVPVDGNLIDDLVTLDESWLTGESRLVEKRKGQLVYAGSVNGAKSFEFLATAVGENAYLSKIINMVETVQGSKAQIQRFADRVSEIFVPAVMSLAVIAGFMWFLFGPEPRMFNAIYTAVSVLVIACPCALGLATPTAVVVASGAAALRGVLFKNVATIEEMREIDTVVFDKTGTITDLGKKVMAYDAKGIAGGTLNSVQLGVLQFMVEATSHPAAVGVKAWLMSQKRDTLQRGEILEFAGKGVSYSTDEVKLFLGSGAWAREQIPSLHSAKDLNLIAGAVVFFTEQEVLAQFVGEEVLRSGAEDLIRGLQMSGYELWLLSGDHHDRVQRIASQVGLAHFAGQLKPEDKLAKIAELQRQGKRVAMIGDGINDGPALAKANVGIAMGSGSDLAVESADVTLLRGSLEQVQFALKLSKETFKTIRQNLFLSLIYNSVGIPWAAGLMLWLFGQTLSPIAASAAMAASSLAVVGNSLLLKWKLSKLGNDATTVP